MRRFSILLAPLLLLAGYAVGRFAATPAPFVAAQITTPAGDVRAEEPVGQIISATLPLSVPLNSPQQVFRDDADKPGRLPIASAPVAEAKSPPVGLPNSLPNDNSDPFAAFEPSQAKTEPAPADIFLPADDFGAAAQQPKAAPAFIPTPLAAKTEQEEKYLNAALKVFRGLGETERQAEFDQMIGRMEEQDAAAELLRLRTELQQLSKKYPKTGAAKKALEAIQTLPVVNAPASEKPAAPALPVDNGFPPSN